MWTTTQGKDFGGDHYLHPVNFGMIFTIALMNHTGNLWPYKKLAPYKSC